MQPNRLSRDSACISFASDSSTLRSNLKQNSSTNQWRAEWQGSSNNSVDVADFNNPSMLVWSIKSAERRELYVNGLLSSGDTTSEAYTTHNRFRIGSAADSSPSSPLEGMVWEVAFWNRTLSKNEIWEMWNAETRWSHYWKPKLYLSVKIPVQDIEGSLLTDADTFNEGFVQPIGLLGSNVEDTDTLSQGDVDHGLFGSILTDADTLNDGLITLNVESSFLSDADILNHGLIDNSDIRNSLLEDIDTFNSGEVIFVGQIQGSIFEDADTFFGAGLATPMFGSILEDADTLFHGDFDLQIFGSLLEDTDTFIQANVHPAEILGSLFQDLDNIFSGEGGNVHDTIYRILITGDVVGGDIVDLVDEVILVSEKETIISKHGVRTETSNV